MSAHLRTDEERDAIRQSIARIGREPVEITVHLQPRRDARRVLSATALHEAADQAAQGVPLPGTNAHAKLTAAIDAGDEEAAAAIREAIRGYAPAIRDAAIAAEDGTRAALERARVTRARKVTARRRAQDAQMRRGARGGDR
jgi:hypothetical protein